jgi:phospholipase C
VKRTLSAALGAALFFASLVGLQPAFAEGNLHKVNHIIVVMQENHSFDNYLGVLAFAPGSPYHNGNGACAKSDHQCVDGLSCTVDPAGNSHVPIPTSTTKAARYSPFTIHAAVCFPISIMAGSAPIEKVISSNPTRR